MLSFRLFGFPVDVQPGFWLLAVIIVAGGKRTALEIAILLGIVIVSLLAHELGHALAARRYGQQPRITLHMMGGLTSWSPSRPQGRGPTIWITLAGPFAGFALAALAFGAVLSLPSDTQGPLRFALEYLMFVNAFWSVVNLLPVLPFDGGQVMAAALGPARRRLAATISLVFGLVAAVAFWRFGMLLGAVFFAMGALQSFFAARETPRASVPPEAVAELLSRASAALEAGDHRQAGTLARAALEATREAATAKRAIEIGGWAALLSGDIPAARATLRGLPPELRPDAVLEAAVLEADGDLGGAAARLLEARREGDQRLDVSAMLVRVLLEQKRFEEAVGVTDEIFDAVDDAEVRQVAERALEGGAGEAAGRLFERLSGRSGNPTDADRALQARAVAPEA